MQGDLEEGECLHTVRLVSIAAQGSMDGRVRSTRGRAMRWRRGEGLPVSGGLFAIGVTDRRVLFWTVTRMLGSPAELSGALPRSDVLTIRAASRLGSRRAAVVLEAGAVYVLRPEQGITLRDLVAAFDVTEETN